jgi:hypothetical protein
MIDAQPRPPEIASPNAPNALNSPGCVASRADWRNACSTIDLGDANGVFGKGRSLAWPVRYRRLAPTLRTVSTTGQGSMVRPLISSPSSANR